MKKITLLTLIFFICLTIIRAQPGRLDSSFGNNGIVKTEFGKTDKDNITLVGQVLVQPDKSIYVTFNGNQVTKKHANGSADSSFGRNGFSSVSSTQRSDQLYAIAIQPDGKIVSLADNVELSEDGEHYVYYFFLNRYKADGSPDSTFKGDKTETSEGEYPDKVFIQKMMEKYL